MRGSVITNEELPGYMPYMTNEEIYSCFSGRISMIGIWEDGRDCPNGFCLVEILPEYMMLHHFEVLDKEQALTVALELLKVCRDVPSQQALPVYAMDRLMVTHGQELGFEPCEDKYFYEIARLHDMNEISVKKVPGLSLHLAEDLPEDELLDAIFRNGADPFFQFPYAEFDKLQLGNSVFATKDGVIKAYVLLEKNDRFLRILDVYGADRESLDTCFYALYRMLPTDFSGNTRLVFLETVKHPKTILKRYFSKLIKAPVHLMRMKAE